jgi:hypothetical protein
VKFTATCFGAPRNTNRRGDTRQSVPADRRSVAFQPEHKGPRQQRPGHLAAQGDAIRRQHLHRLDRDQEVDTLRPTDYTDICVICGLEKQSRDVPRDS